MKRLLRSKANFKVLEGFLSELLKEEIRIVEILESESNQEGRFDKFNRLDLKAKTLDEEIILIEVQYEQEFDYLQRILYSTSKTVTEHMDKGQAYADIVKVISISILYFDLGQGKDYIYHGMTSFRGLNLQDELLLTSKQAQMFEKKFPYQLYPEYYLIKVNTFDDVAKNTLDEWIYFLKNEEIKEDFQAKGLREAKEILDILRLSDEDRKAYERYSDDLHYQASMVLSSYGSGKMDGIEQGVKQGIEQGVKQGVKQGIEQGVKQGLVESARKLFGCGMSRTEIAKILGIDENAF
ncbi:MAG: Rpn family recombination-promoting nuclease/putative transposase [Candidatus Riflebacteria bacterium]|nr:Rpn family recombination-promoting nuclease/putative transposase [Candidatus Riflebacteria bacterium]